MRRPHLAPWLALLGMLALVASAPAITLDGQLDAEYGPAISVQTLGVINNDNLLGELRRSTESELDALHATVADGVLYLFIAGNQLSVENASDPGFFADHLHLFFDTRPGGQASLRADNFAVGSYPGHDVLLHMAGLRFDPGFEADWWLSDFPTGAVNWGIPWQLHAWRAELLTGGSGPGEYLGWTDAGPTAGLTGGSNPLGVSVALDNHNVAGVPNGCVAASGSGVSTGIEWAIPLAALGNPEGCVKLCAFTTYKGANRMENQSLPPLPPGTCPYFTPSLFDFGAFAGAQWIELCGTSTPTAPGTWGRLKTLYR